MDPFKDYQPRPKAATPRLTVSDAEAVALQRRGLDRGR